MAKTPNGGQALKRIEKPNILSFGSFIRRSTGRRGNRIHEKLRRFQILLSQPSRRTSIALEVMWSKAKFFIGAKLFQNFLKVNAGLLPIIWQRHEYAGSKIPILCIMKCVWLVKMSWAKGKCSISQNVR